MSGFDILPPAGGSSNRLSSLFGNGGGGGGGGSGGGGGAASTDGDENNDPLRYAQPKRQQQQQDTQPQVLHATGATLYQFDQTQQQFVLVGKVGCAVLGTRQDNTHSYRLLCYRSSKDPVCSAQIYNEEKGGFSFTLQQGNYGTFYDDHRRLFSVLFKAPDDALHFAVYVTIAKFAAGGSKQLAHVDLQQGEGNNTIEDGCKVSVKYTGWLLIDRNEQGVPKLGKVFDSNMSSGKGLTIRVAGLDEKLYVIRGWNEGIKGMKFKNSKRFIVIPSAMAYGANGYPPEIPPNSNLCFQIEVIKARRSGTNSEISSVASQTPPPALHHFQSESPSPQPPVQTTATSGKDDMKKRMAKLGMPSPFNMINDMEQPQQHQHHSPEDDMFKSVESEAESYQSAFTPTGSSQTTANFAPQAQMKPQQPHFDQSSELAKLQQQVALFQSMLQQQQQPQQPQQQQQQKHNTHDGDDENAEQEQQKQLFQSLEKKMFAKMNELSRKIENIDLTYLLEMRDDSYSGGDSGELTTKRKKERLMSGTMLMQNIQHLVSTNETLRLDLTKEREKLDQLIEKMNELRKRNEKYADEMNERYISNSNDHDYMRKDLERTQEQLSDQKNKNTEAQITLQQQRDRNLELQEQNSKLNETNHKLEQTIQELQRQLKMQELQFREQIDELKREHQRTQSDLMSTEKEKYLQVSEQLTSQKARSETLERQLEQLRELSSEEIAQQREKVAETQELMRKTVDERDESLKTAFRERIMQFKQEMLEEQRYNIQNVSKLLLAKVFAELDSSMGDKQSYYRGSSVQQVIASKIKMLMGALIEHTNTDDDEEDEQPHEFDYDEFVAFVDSVIGEADEITLSVYEGDDDDDAGNNEEEEHKDSKKKTKHVTIENGVSVVSDEDSSHEIFQPSAAQPIQEEPFSTTATDGGDERVLSERDEEEVDNHDDEDMDEDRLSEGTISMTVSSTIMDPNLIHIRDDQSITTSCTLGDEEERQAVNQQDIEEGEEENEEEPKDDVQEAEEEETQTGKGSDHGDDDGVNDIEDQSDEKTEEQHEEQDNEQNAEEEEKQNFEQVDEENKGSDYLPSEEEHVEENVNEPNFPSAVDVEEPQDNPLLAQDTEDQSNDEKEDLVEKEVEEQQQEDDTRAQVDERQTEEAEDVKEPGEEKEEIYDDTTQEDLDPFGVAVTQEDDDDDDEHKKPVSLFDLPQKDTPTKKHNSLFDDPMDDNYEQHDETKKSKPMQKKSSLFDDPSDDDEDENVLAPVKASKKKSLFDDDDDVFANPVSSTPTTTSLFVPRELSEEEQQELKAKKKKATTALFSNDDGDDFFF